MVNEYFEHDYFSSDFHDDRFRNLNQPEKTSILNNIMTNGNICRLDYLCSACHESTRLFLVRFYKKDGEGTDHLFVEKVGQFPAWDIEMDKGLEKTLGEHAYYYKRGLICESQGYGVGAYAYYRRVIENIIEHLLGSIANLLEGEDKKHYEAALESTKADKKAQDRIQLVKDLLPKSLRPEGINPLDIIYSSLSGGLHAEDDSTCLDYAGDIKNALVYLVNEILKKKEHGKTFTASMKKLLDKRAKSAPAKKGA